jgi:hypothetical protein
VPCFGVLPPIVAGIGGALGVSSMSSSSVERHKDSKGETIVTRLERTPNPPKRTRAKGAKRKVRTMRKPKIERLVVKLVDPVGRKGYILKNGKRVSLNKKPLKGLPLKKAYATLIQRCQENGFDKC